MNIKYRDITFPFKQAALAYPNIRMAMFNDVYKLNDNEDNNYVAFVMSLKNTEHQDGFFIYHCDLFYVDRATEGGDNNLEIYSEGTYALSQIIKKVQNGQDYFVIDDGYVLIPFRERFSDECDGVYTSIVIRVPDSICEDY